MMQKIAIECQKEIYDKYNKGALKSDLAKTYGLTWTRIDQIIKRYEKMSKNPSLNEKLWMKYPDIDRNIVSGAINAILRYYLLHTDTIHLNKYMTSYSEFFSLVEKIDFDEMLNIKSMGIVKARFLKRALNDYKKGGAS